MGRGLETFRPALLTDRRKLLSWAPGGCGGRLRGWLPAQPPSPSLAGAFFFPYFIFFFTCGIPVFFLEVALGQYTSQGSVTAWRKICPLLQGECRSSHTHPPAIALPASFIHPVLRAAEELGRVIRLPGARSF